MNSSAFPIVKGCISGVMDGISEWEIGKLSSDSSQVYYIHVNANTLWKGINPLVN